MSTTLNIAFLSDTHRRHLNIRVPPCDILVFCGDATSSRGATGLQELDNFLRWMVREAKGAKCVMIFGNHDWVGTTYLSECRILCERHGVTLLHDSGATVEGVSFWGSPRTPEFCGWAFMYSPDEAPGVWESIPENTDVIVTHGPPFGILDTTEFGVHVGCPELCLRVHHIAPAIHAFGHIHEGRGVRMGYWTCFVNAAVVDRYAHEFYEPTVITLEDSTGKWRPLFSIASPDEV